MYPYDPTTILYNRFKMIYYTLHTAHLLATFIQYIHFLPFIIARYKIFPPFSRPARVVRLSLHSLFILPILSLSLDMSSLVEDF
jgi:hypothetical protein